MESVRCKACYATIANNSGESGSAGGNGLRMKKKESDHVYRIFSGFYLANSKITAKLAQSNMRTAPCSECVVYETINLI